MTAEETKFRTSKTEAPLVRRAIEGDPEAFAQLYLIYADRIHRFVLFRVGDEQMAEDLTSQTFLKAWEKLDHYQMRGLPFGAWLFRIARNTIANAHRTRSRRRTEPMEAIPLEPPAPDADPAGLALRAEEARRIRAAVAALPDDRRQVVLLRFADGLSAREIGQVLDRSEGAVRVLLHRALKDLAGQLHS